MDEPTFSRCVSAKTRVYYIDAHVDRKGQQYISISEIPKDKTPGKKERQRVFIHSENIDAFADAFAQVSQHVKGYANA